MDSRLTTRGLSPETWGDFERLFLKKGRWGSCWCMIYHREASPPKKYTGPEGLRNASYDRRAKRALVMEGRSHGVLVYAEGEPVGWCQYGPRGELPRVDRSNLYRKLSLDSNGERLWRITCFWVLRKYRGRGVASAALHAALDAIRKEGGGLVEGYPAVRKGFPADWNGTLSMFEKEGFVGVAPYGRYNVLVRRTMSRATSRAPRPRGRLPPRRKG